MEYTLMFQPISLDYKDVEGLNDDEPINYNDFRLKIEENY